MAGDYSTCGPVRENIAVCRALHAQGHTIIIATSRRMRTHEGNAAATVADIGEVRALATPPPAPPFPV